MTPKNRRTSPSPSAPSNQRKPVNTSRAKPMANTVNRVSANYSRKNAGAYMTSNGSGVLSVPGRVRDVGRYGERLGEKQKFPNRRRKIITGQELTTPLRRKKAAERVRQEKINIKITTISAKKKKFPVSVIFGIFLCSCFLSCLIWTYIVLHEKTVNINELNENISAEKMREKILAMKLDAKNDLSFIISYAENKLGAVKEDLLQKYYVYSKLDDKVEVMGEKNNIIDNLPNIMSAISGGKDNNIKNNQ